MEEEVIVAVLGDIRAGVVAPKGQMGKARKMADRITEAIRGASRESGLYEIAELIRGRKFHRPPGVGRLKPDVSMALNGALAGLVSITAPCYTVTPMASIWIGLIGGILVVLSVIFIDKVLKVDDPVGAISVHGVCGAWGTLSCGLFNAEKLIGIGDANGGLLYGGGIGQLVTQGIGVGAAFLWAFLTGLILFNIIKATIGIRVTKEEELKGLDISEHGMEAYAGFQIFTNE